MLAQACIVGAPPSPGSPRWSGSHGSRGVPTARSGGCPNREARQGRLDSAGVDHDDASAGGHPLHRQERPAKLDAAGRPSVPQRVPETRPTPLTDAFIHLSLIVLVCGVAAIVALEMGTPMSSPLVKLPVLVGGVVLLVVTVDALVRVWRSVGAWRPVDRGRALFRLLWAAILASTLSVVAAIMLVVAWA